jgi:triosephosphate isomerase
VDDFDAKGHGEANSLPKGKSMRRRIIAGNWKMNLRRNSCLALAHGILDRCESSDRVEIVLCPPSVYLHDVGAAIRGHSLTLAAQNMSEHQDGAYTGEISAGMLVDLGCKMVILGHSERRHGMGETSAQVHQKALQAHQHQLTPIVCVGETLEERDGGRTGEVIETQCRESLGGLSAAQMTSTVIAYEPVWAIGTGRTATPQQAEEVHGSIRRWLAETFGKDVAQSVVIQYGGSVKAENARSLLEQPNVDGALVGGASLQVESFVGIIQAAIELAKGSAKS